MADAVVGTIGPAPTGACTESDTVPPTSPGISRIGEAASPTGGDPPPESEAIVTTGTVEVEVVEGVDAVAGADETVESVVVAGGAEVDEVVVAGGTDVDVVVVVAGGTDVIVVVVVAGGTDVDVVVVVAGGTDVDVVVVVAGGTDVDVVVVIAGGTDVDVVVDGGTEVAPSASAVTWKRAATAIIHTCHSACVAASITAGTELPSLIVRILSRADWQTSSIADLTEAASFSISGLVRGMVRKASKPATRPS